MWPFRIFPDNKLHLTSSGILAPLHRGRRHEDVWHSKLAAVGLWTTVVPLAPRHFLKWAGLTLDSVKVLWNRKKIGRKKARQGNIHLHTLYLDLYKFLSQLLKQMTVIKQIPTGFYYFQSCHWISQVPVNLSHIKQVFKQQVLEAELDSVFCIL